jgi:uncharacterized protein
MDARAPAAGLGAGLGLKPQYFDAALDWSAPGAWFELHPENYFVDGGPRLAWLEAIRSRHPLSLHGVGMSLAGEDEPDHAHLQHLAHLTERIEPALVSEHLAWSSADGVYFPDLLPFPRTDAALARIAAHIERVQDRLKRRIAIENPSHYLNLDGHEWDEVDFLCELARRTGCGLLLDLNNVYVSANNLGYVAEDVVDRFPAQAVAEIHLAGHSVDPQLGAGLLIDSHDAPVCEPVWRLYARLIERIGPRPTLIERDGNLPAFEHLLQERARAQETLEGLHALHEEQL